MAVIFFSAGLTSVGTALGLLAFLGLAWGGANSASASESRSGSVSRGNPRWSVNARRRAKLVQLFVCGVAKRGQYDFLLGLFVIFVVPGEVAGDFL